MRYLIVIILLLLAGCCSQVKKEETIKIDSVYIEKIVRDSIYIEAVPKIVFIDTTKFEIKPFYAYIDSIYEVNQKKTKIMTRFTMFRPDSTLMNIDIEELTGEKSMTLSRTKLHTIKEVIKEKTPILDFIAFLAIGLVVGYILGKIVK